MPFVWSDKAAEAYKTLKDMVTTAPILQTFREDLPVIVTTDPSKKAIGAVLEQDGPGGRRTVAFASRTLNAAEQNYAAHELELIGIVDTLRAWGCYRHDRKFIVHRDHYPLLYIQTQEHFSPGQVRWIERLVEFEFTIIPVEGKSKQIAGALSRQSKSSKIPRSIQITSSEKL